MTYAASREIKQSFDRDGFVAIRSFLNPLETERVQRRMDEYVRDIVPLMPRNHAFYEDKSRPETLKQLQDLADYDVFFGRLFVSEPFVSLAELLLGDAL